MKITIEPETDAEKALPQIKRIVLADLAAVAIVGISAEDATKTALYFHAPDVPLANLPALQHRVRELDYQLTKIRLVNETAQAKQPPLIQVAQPTVRFPAGNDRLRT